MSTTVLRGMSIPMIRHQIASRVNLLSTLVRRELAARYRGSVFGALWPFAIQISQLLVFIFLFGALLHTKVAVGRLPASPFAFGLWLFAGLGPWNAFVNGVVQSATAIVGQPHLVKKLVFPLAILPLVPVVSALIESLAGLAILVVFTATEAGVGPSLFLLPLLLGCQLLFTSGIAYIVAAASVFFRDTVQALNPVLLVWFYTTPIVYSPAQLPLSLHWMLVWNPFAILAEQYRSVILGGAIDATAIALLGGTGIGVFVAGFLVFRSVRSSFPDVL